MGGWDGGVFFFLINLPVSVLESEPSVAITS